MNGEGNAESVRWVVKVLLRFPLKPEGAFQTQELLYVQYMESTQAFSGVDR